MDRKVWLVTGGTSGLGAALIDRLAVPVYRVGSTPILERKTIGGDKIVFDVVCSFLDPAEACRRIEEAITRAWHLPDVIVNCAGMNFIHPTHKIDIISFEDVFRVNVYMPMYLTSNLLVGKLISKNPVVINIGSNACFGAGAFSAAYVASKHALTGVTKSLVKDYGDKAKIVQINFGKLENTRMSRYIDNQQAKLRGISVEEERERQRKGWKFGSEISLDSAAKLIIDTACAEQYIEQGRQINYGF